MTQSDLNKLTQWVDEVKAAHKIRTDDGDLGGTPTQLNFKQSVASGLTGHHIINVKVHGQEMSNRFYSIFLEQQEQAL